MTVETAYYGASGPAFSDCCFLGQRYEAETGYKPYEAECWICGVEVNPKGGYTVHAYRGSTAWFTGLWRSPAGRLYVCDAEGRITMNSDLKTDYGKGTWEEHKTGDALFGMWGLDDNTVFAWGSRIKDHPVYRFDGKAWSEIANPGFKIESMHGIASDFVYAVGHDGGIARFDGKSWQRFPAPSPEQLTSVFVAGPDEMYAVGAAGSVLEGSAHGWGKIGEGPGLPGPLQCVAKFKGELWVGAGRFGLARRKGTTSEMELIKPNIHAVSFDVGQNMVIATKDVIFGTADGVSFKGTAKGWLLDNLSGKPLCYFA
jgi:hypothetical protein